MSDVCKGEENIQVFVENFIDDEHLPDVKYTPFNVAGPGCECDPSEITYTGCDCQNEPCGTNCPCIQRSVGHSYDVNGCLLSNTQACPISKPILECNSLCQCRSSCQNRVVQNGLKFRVEVFRTEQKGWGLKALENIPRNQFVCEYAGEVLGYEEAHRRASTQSKDDPNYIHVLKEHLQNGKVLKTCVDPTYLGNIGRYINHCCDPNLYMAVVRIDNEVPKLALFAKREILDEEELSFDYAGEIGATCDNEATSVCNNLQNCNKNKSTYIDENGESGNINKFDETEVVDMMSMQSVGKPCYCGSDTCRGFLPFDHELYTELDSPTTSHAEDQNCKIDDDTDSRESDEDLWKDELPNDVFLQLTTQLETKCEVAKYVNHSGGAIGSDLFWQQISRNYGIQTRVYSFKGHSPNNPSRIELSNTELKEADIHLHKANKVLHRVFPSKSSFVNNLLRRDWFQIRDTEGVFAVGKIAKNRKTVEGGTGWTVQMALYEQKPVHVFDCRRNKSTKVTEGTCLWHRFSFKQRKFVVTDTPTLTYSFTGIGTRDLPERGKVAIRDVFLKTFEH